MIEKLKNWLHRQFGKCVAGPETIEVQEVEVCPPGGPIEHRKLRVATTECGKCGRLMNLEPRGFTD